MLPFKLISTEADIMLIQYAGASLDSAASETRSSLLLRSREFKTFSIDIKQLPEAPMNPILESVSTKGVGCNVLECFPKHLEREKEERVRYELDIF